MLSRLAATVNRCRTKSSPVCSNSSLKICVRLQAVKLGQKVDRVVMRRASLGRFAREIQLHAIAGRKQHRLRLRIAAAKPRQGLRRLLAATPRVTGRSAISGGRSATRRAPGSNSLVTGAPTVHTTPEQARVNLETTLAIERAVQTGLPVKLPLDG